MSCDEHSFLGHDTLESRKLCDWMKNMTSGLKWILGKKLWLRPWMVPGSAPIFSPCGVNGGNPFGCPAGRDNRTRTRFNPCHKGGWAFGRPATDYGWQHAASTTWEAGSVQSTVWWMGQHHGEDTAIGSAGQYLGLCWGELTFDMICLKITFNVKCNAKFEEEKPLHSQKPSK